jgi:hypothetical protein
MRFYFCDGEGTMRRILLFLVVFWLANGSAVAGEKIPWDKITGLKVSDFKAEFVSEVAEKLEKIQCYGRCSDSVAACLRKDPPHATAVRLARDAFFLMAENKGPE